MKNLFSPVDWLDTALHMLFGAALFVIIGYFTPKIYYEHFDKTNYYKIFSPIPVELHMGANQCPFIDAYIHRIALVPIEGTSVRQLTLVRVDRDGTFERIANFRTDISADVGEATIIAHWMLPCDLSEGKYFFQGVASFQVKGIHKTTPFKTDEFIMPASFSAILNGHNQ